MSRAKLAPAAILALVLAAPDLGARPGGGQSFKSPSRPSSPSSPSRPSSPSSPSRPSTPSWPSTPSTPSRPSTPSWPSSPSRPSSPSWPSSPSSPSSPSWPSSPSTPSDPSHPDTGPRGERSFSGFFSILLLALVMVVLIVVIYVRWRDGMRGPEWESGILDAPPRRQVEKRDHAEAYRSLVGALAAIRAHDPEFSFVLFEDFLYALYTEAHTARGEGRMASVSPYLSLDARASLGTLGARPVRTIVIGSLSIEDVVPGGAASETTLTALFQTNYAEVDDAGNEHAYYAEERWTLSRAAGVKSRPPERAAVIDCPSCGAPLDKLVGGTCRYCDEVVDKGGFDWVVTAIELLPRDERGPMLTGTTEEVGTSDPTVVAPDVEERWRALTERDPALDWAALTARIELVFRTFHEAWTAQDPRIVRPYLSDNLFQTQRYWVEAYQRQKLRNLTDGARIVAVHLARIVSDARFDALTVRVFATGLDYTVDELGKVVAGSTRKERAYSEYWTLIRGASRAGPAGAAPVCPSCGGGIAVSMAGKCDHCGAKVTSGEFDWVLSRIEQDETYG